MNSVTFGAILGTYFWFMIRVFEYSFLSSVLLLLTPGGVIFGPIYSWTGDSLLGVAAVALVILVSYGMPYFDEFVKESVAFGHGDYETMYILGDN